MSDKKLRILAVDDNKDNLTTLKAVLRDAFPETELFTAMSGPECLELARTVEPDIILLDIIMPGMDGFSVCSKLKEDARLSRIPVVFLTALRTSREDRIRALETGAEGFLSKPVELAELTAQVRAMAKIRYANLYEQTRKEQLEHMVAERTISLQKELAERKAAQEKLKKNEANLNEAQRIASLGNWEYDLDLKKIEWSDEVYRIFGREKREGPADSEALGKRLSPEDDKTLKALITAVIKTGKGCEGEVVLNFAGGKSKVLRVVVSPEKGNNGKLSFLRGIVQDVTRSKEFEKYLLQTKKMEAIGSLTGGIAHDFNNLLAVIIGYSDVALKFTSKGSAIGESVTEIKKSAEKAAALTSQLLAFSRKQPISRSVMSLNESIVELNKILGRIIGEDIDFKLVLDPALKNVFADRGQIDQIIINLVTNSHSAMPDGGKLTLKTENVELDAQSCIKLPESRPGEFACLIVKDTGTGMSKEVLDHLFEPYFTTKSVGKGSGLGLSVIYGIVKQMEGWINVSSSAGKGSEFKIFLPVVALERELDLKNDKFKGEYDIGKGQRILIAEDEKVIREMVCRQLEEKLYTVFCAKDGLEALKMFDKQDGKIDLLFTDSVMPGLKGLALAKKLKAKNPALKVIVSSGYMDDKSSIEEAEKEGYVFLPKPYEIREMLSQVSSLLKGIAGPTQKVDGK